MRTGSVENSMVDSSPDPDVRTRSVEISMVDSSHFIPDPDVRTGSVEISMVDPGHLFRIQVRISNPVKIKIRLCNIRILESTKTG